MGARFFWLLLAVTVGSFSFTACGGDDDDETGDDTTTDDDSAATDDDASTDDDSADDDTTGDDDSADDDAAGDDDTSDDDDDAAPGAHNVVAVANTDYATGAALSLVDLTSKQAFDGFMSLTADPVVRYDGANLWVLERFGADKLHVLDPANGWAEKFAVQLDAGANPQDVVVKDDKAYVTQYGLSELLVVNTADGAIAKKIDLSAFADDDGIPEMAALALAGDKLFVALQRLDQANGFVASNTSYVVVIDTASDSIVDVDAATPEADGIELPYANPTTGFITARIGGREVLLIGCSGNWDDTDGGLAYIDPLALTAAAGISEATFGGEISGLATDSEGRTVVLVGDANFVHTASYFDISTGTKNGNVLQGFDQDDVGAIAFDSSGDIFALVGGALRVHDPGITIIGDYSFALPGVSMAYVP